MKTLHSKVGAWWCGALLACFGTPAAAQLTTTATNNAYDLGAALAPLATGLTSVTGVSVDLGDVSAPAGQIGTFTGGFESLGFATGIVLSTGSVAEIFTGALDTSGVDHGRTPTGDTPALLAQVPGGGSGFFDPVRFTVAIDPGFDANFINFDLAFGTNEVGATTDRIGIFVNGLYYGLLAGSPIDQFHPWIEPAGSQFGFGANLYPDGSTVAYPSVKVSLPVLTPAQVVTLDILLADVTDGTVDSALFLGNLTGSEVAKGVVLAPVPIPAALPLLIGALAVTTAFVRRSR